jgi:hypothetical protein
MGLSLCEALGERSELLREGLRNNYLCALNFIKYRSYSWVFSFSCLSLLTSFWEKREIWLYVRHASRQLQEDLGGGGRKQF